MRVYWGLSMTHDWPIVLSLVHHESRIIKIENGKQSPMEHGKLHALGTGSGIRDSHITISGIRDQTPSLNETDYSICCNLNIIINESVEST